MFGKRSTRQQEAETHRDVRGGDYQAGGGSDSKKITRNYRDEEVMRPPMVQLDKKTGKGRI